jgi:hypothetical protein
MALRERLSPVEADGGEDGNQQRVDLVELLGRDVLDA